MARLEPLIKVRKQAVDDKQRVLAALYREQDTIIAAKEKLLASLADERARLETMPTDLDARKWFAQFETGVKQRVATFDAGIAKLETRIMVARDDMRAAFAEYKKIEITDRERKKRSKKEMDDKISLDMDEIGLEGHRRRDDT